MTSKSLRMNLNTSFGSFTMPKKGDEESKLGSDTQSFDSFNASVGENENIIMHHKKFVQPGLIKLNASSMILKNDLLEEFNYEKKGLYGENIEFYEDY